MPRSYRFDHFTTLKSNPSRALLRRHKQKFTELKSETGEPRIQYGKQYAQTEELYHAHEMASQLEALAGLEEPEATTQPQPAPRWTGRAGPIGSLPETPEAPVLTQWSELWETSLRHVRVLTQSLKEARTAAIRIAETPWEGAKLAARIVTQKVRTMPAWS
jgi:hypothetical protein